MNAEPSMFDLARPQTVHRITQIAHDPQSVTLAWDDGRQDRFSARWLRDNCACSHCRHPQALERTYMFLDHPRPTITTARLDPDGSVSVNFLAGEEQHASVFARGWLRTYGFSEADRSTRRRATQLWDATLRSRLPTVSYERYLQTDDGLRFWIESLQTHGVVLLRGVPQEPGRLREVAQRIGPIRVTNFGEHYDVKSVANPNASADTAMGLELHTDLANWYSPPDIQMLCCLKSSAPGGDSLFADGYKVADDLRTSDPVAYSLLCQHPFEFRFHDANCDIRTVAPAITLDLDGQPRVIRFNNWLRGPMMMAESVAERMYDELENLWLHLRKPSNHLNLRLEPGDLIAYDNHRVLHGRTAFDPRVGERHLQGCYINREDLESKLRLLDRPRV